MASPLDSLGDEVVRFPIVKFKQILKHYTLDTFVLGRFCFAAHVIDVLVLDSDVAGRQLLSELIFSARCNIYISRLCYDASVRLSVRLSVCL